MNPARNIRDYRVTVRYRTEHGTWVDVRYDVEATSAQAARIACAQHAAHKDGRDQASARDAVSRGIRRQARVAPNSAWTPRQVTER